MSTIHEALQRAQKRRDIDSRITRLSLSASGGRARPFRTGKFWGIFGILVIIFLALGLHSWLDFEALQEPLPSGKKIPASLQTMQTERTDRAGASYDRARTFHRGGNLDGAKRLYEQTLETNPGYVDALNNLGVILLGEQSYDKARSRFEKAIRLKPGYVDPYYNLACLHAIRGELKEGMARLRQAISLDPIVKEWAQNDIDLKNLRDLPAFQDIVGNGKFR